MVESFEEGGKEPEGVVAADDMMGTQVETRKVERSMPPEEQVLGSVNNLSWMWRV